MKDIFETKYRTIRNKKGNIYKIACLNNFKDFIKGDIYFSEISPKTIKAWRKHSELSCVIGVVIGEVIIKIRPSNSNECFVKKLSLDNGELITINPGNWYGFQNRKSSKCLLFVMLNGEHLESEVERMELDVCEW